MVTTAVLLNLNVASRAELNQASVLGGPIAEFFLILKVKESTSFSFLSFKELPLSTVGVDAKAILLGEVTASKRTRIELTGALHGTQGFIKCKSIELGISLLVSNGSDLAIIDDFSTIEMRALNAHQLENLNNNSDSFSSNDGFVVMESWVLSDLNSEIG